MTREWIEHDGKGPPDLEPGTWVTVRLRGLPLPEWFDPFEYWSPDASDTRDYWVHTGGINDIVAYTIYRGQ